MQLPSLQTNITITVLLWVGLTQIVRAQDDATAMQIPKDTQRLDVFLMESKVVSSERPIDEATATPSGILKIDKVENSPNQISVLGLVSGNAILKVVSAGRTINYAVEVTPAPERIYINIPESKRLSLPASIDTFSTSVPGVVRVNQADTDDRVLLVEALRQGRTTLTVVSNKQIYRFYIATFDNRGADVLEIQNQFSSKGYRNLKISFQNDQAIISGFVPTQEELDDAVRIVKEFCPYVQVNASLGEPLDSNSETSEQEQIIINNIKHISGISNVVIQVRFPAPSTVSTSTYIKQTGDELDQGATTATASGVVTTPSTLKRREEDQNSLLEPRPLENTTEEVTVRKNNTIPDRIYLFGELEDDLQEARLLRVARTFCPFVSSFLTVKDPIQLRITLRFMQVDEVKSRETGVDWGANGPSLRLGLYGNSVFSGGGVASEGIQALASGYGGLNGSFISGLMQLFDSNTGSPSLTATLHLFESNNAVKKLRESDVFLSNGQPGWYSEGEIQYYISAAVTTASSPPITTLTSTPIFYGINLDIAPLNTTAAGGQEPTAEKILGIPTSISNSSAEFDVENSKEKSAAKVGNLTQPVQTAGTIPIIDSSVKYVDENGVIGLSISTQLSVPNTTQTVTFGTSGNRLDLPDYFVRTTHTRASLRDGQTVSIAGLLDKETARDIAKVPFFEKLPIFGSLFKNYTDSDTQRQVVIMITPKIIRMRDADSKRIFKPAYPAMQHLAEESGMIPQIQPVVLSKAVDLLPEEQPTNDKKDVKGMEDPKNSTLAPRTTGGVQPVNGGTTAVDKLSPPKDNNQVKSAPPVTSSP